MILDNAKNIDFYRTLGIEGRYAKAIDFLKGMLDYEKSLGKTSMRKLLMKGGDLQVL